MGITQSEGTEHNLYWNIDHFLGDEFENIIYKIIITEFKARLYKDIKIEHTPQKNDGGKDIIIEFSSQSLNLFDIVFYKEEKAKAKIYIECKSSNSRQALRREKFLPSIQKGMKTKADYYVLLTNSKINPIDYYDAEQLLNSENIKFVLIDQYLLARFIKKNNYNYLGEIPLYEGKDDFYTQYQVYQNELNNRYDIYFTFRNYSKYVRLYTISLLTDVNWNTEENSFSFTINPNCAYSKKISLVCDYENEFKTLVFKVESGKFESFVDIKGINIEERYEPPFIGRYHNKILFRMLNNIISPNSDKLFCLWGEAGIGKTRIVYELKRKLAGGYFDIYECSLNKDNTSTIQEIQDFLIKKEYMSVDFKKMYTTNLYDTIINCKHSIKSAIIFIDDFHNSSSMLIEQIKKLYQHTTPVILIICGRTDYTEGNTAYYSFVQWSLENLKMQKNIWNVKPLRPNETKNLIRTMIKEIPEEALTTIYHQSNNNPLYIVQFIEYLLDEKIAYIVNRNTVGIVNPTKFKAHNYLPNEISDIYSKRIAYLIKISEKHEKDYLKFLFVLTLFNGDMPVNIVEQYFDPDGVISSFLYKRKFISKIKNHYVFFHESLKIYIHHILLNKNEYKQELSSYMLKIPERALENIPQYSMGRLYLWNGNIKKAFEIFSPLIDSIRNIKNISNVEIDASTYEYFDDILQIFIEKEEYIELAKRTINGKIYITLHHFIPINAANECDKSISYINSSAFLREDKKFIHALLTQKAHSLLNSGMNIEGELVLKELLSKWLVSPEEFDLKSVFDMLDRLCAIYIKFNCYDMAYNYSHLEFETAKKCKDDSLIAIAHRTRSKLFYLNDLEECQYSLDKVDELLKMTPSSRIQLNNNIYRAIVDLTYNTKANFDEIINRIENLATTASKQNLNRADIQSNMVLSAAYLKRGTFSDLQIAKQKIKKAINYSIRYGIPSYMWQLYNLLAIVDTKLKTDNNKIKQSFEMSFDILNRQHLLYVGRNDLCYSNILAISNIGFFLRKHVFQKTFNARMSKIVYCESAKKNEVLKNKNKQLPETELTIIYEKASKKELLFSSMDSSKLLMDDETGYFIALT